MAIEKVTLKNVKVTINFDIDLDNINYEETFGNKNETKPKSDFQFFSDAN